MEIYREEFASIAQFIRAMGSRQVNKVFAGEKLSSKEGSKSFTGTESLNEANELLQYGDKASAQKLDRQMRINAAKGSGMKRKSTVKKDFTGFAPIVGAYLAGDTECMLNINTKMRKHSRVVNLLWNISIASHVSAEEIVEQGARVLTLVDSLERRGYSVNLSTMFASMSRQKKECVICIVKIKDAAQRMSVLKCAYPLVNPSFLRRHTLQYMERHPQLTASDYAYGYGTPVLKKNYPEEHELLFKNSKWDTIIDINTEPQEIERMFQ